MPAIKLTAFSGEQPRIIARLLPETAAQDAVNVRLDDGGLTPVNRPVQVQRLAASGARSIYRHQGDWLSWSTVVNAAPGPVAQDRLYYTGDGAPKMRVGAEVYDLAIAPPTTALEATLAGTGSGDVVTRIYIYTWVSSFGEESEPCPASVSVDWMPGQSVTLSGFAAVPSGRAITTQRIYRSQTGQSGTYFYLIAERPASSSNFNDAIAVDAFQEPLPAAGWNAPPAGLEGLIALPNGMMAAFQGRDLYFCEPWRPHAWPEKYVQTTDAPIVALGAIGTSVIVMTKGFPWLVAGSHPSAMQMVKLAQNLPCINARGVVDLGFAIAFPSNEGLVAARADGSIGIVSGNLFSRDDWLALSPSTFVAGQISGRYVAFYDTTDPTGKVVAGAAYMDVGETPFLMRSSERAAAVHYEVESGALYYLPPGEVDIYRLDAPGGARAQLYWRSKEFVLPYPENFGALLIDSDRALSGTEEAALQALIAQITAGNATLIAAGPLGGELNGAVVNRYAYGGDALALVPSLSTATSVGVFADGVRVATISRTGRPVRLPSGFLARKWVIDVSTDERIEQIVMAKSIDELRQVP